MKEETTAVQDNYNDSVAHPSLRPADAALSRHLRRQSHNNDRNKSSSLHAVSE